MTKAAYKVLSLVNIISIDNQRYAFCILDLHSTHHIIM